MSEIQVNKLSPQSGTTVTLGDSGDTFTIPSGATIANSGTATGFGEANTPSFGVYITGGDQNIPNATVTTITFNTEDWDTNSAFDTSNYRFTVPSGQAGKYYFSSRIYMEYGNNANEIGRLGIYKNGTAVAIFGGLANGTENQGKSLSVNTILDLAVSDYVEMKIYHNQGGTQAIDDDPDFTYFTGFKVTT
jgi:hypothetical protein